MKRYEAPWSTSLVLMSVLVTVLLLGVSTIGWWEVAAKSYPLVFRWVAVLPLVLLFGAALFTIRGYTISSDAIIVHRLLWSTHLPRIGLESACVEPDVMRGSLRTFGNGGGFSITGLYYNKRLGSYRAFVTDPHRTVVLRYANRRVVVSPEMPERFVNDLRVRRDVGACPERAMG
jgi:hypothetical protein